MSESTQQRSPEIRRYIAAAAAVAVWMAAGWLTDAGPNAYLLIGVPITFIYQRWVVRRPVYTLWVRDTSDFHIDRTGVLVALALALAPVYNGALYITRREPDVILWMLCALGGAVAAGFAVPRLKASGFRELLKCLAVAGTIGCTLMILGWAAKDPAPIADLSAGLKSLLLYFAVGFVLEEVFFRGTLDAHVFRPGDRGGFLAAIFISVLWGIWHLPVAPRQDAGAVIGLIVVHTLIGVPLSIYWRRSGNLAVPVAAHALIDAVRNALILR